MECGGLDLDVSFEIESLCDLCDGIGIVSSIQISHSFFVLVHKRSVKCGRSTRMPYVKFFSICMLFYFIFF